MKLVKIALTVDTNYFLTGNCLSINKFSGLRVEM